MQFGRRINWSKREKEMKRAEWELHQQQSEREISATCTHTLKGTRLLTPLAAAQ